MIDPDVRHRLNAAQLLRQPLMQTRDARKYIASKAKKRKFKDAVAAKDRELVQVYLELQMAREREQNMLRELQRLQELAANEKKMEEKLTEMYSMMQQSLSIQK